MQQYLPFTVLKLVVEALFVQAFDQLQQYLPFTVLKLFLQSQSLYIFVATVLTVYGIETDIRNHEAKGLQELQQYLPFTVLKQH